MKFKVNKDLCIGCGACQGMCDDVFNITDEGYAEVIKEEVTDKEEIENAMDALEGCPTEAIKKED